MALSSVFTVEGMHCSNCAVTVERAVRALEGVQRFSVNAATARASVEWNPDQLSLNKVLNAVRKAGFKAIPLEGEEAADSQRLERRLALKRIGVAGLGMMQTMMFVYALYAGGSHGINPDIAQYLRLAGMLLATPVLIYSGAPFFSAALRDLRQRRLGMDVPVSAALALAFVASVVNTLRGEGQVYYDSVTMFIFLLSLGRFAEMAVRQRSLSATEAFARSLPSMVTRISAEGATERVPLTAVVPGDRLSVARGAIVPVDASLSSLHALLDESLITGESRPVRRVRDDPVMGGSINTTHAIEIVCRASVEKSTLAGIVGLLRRAGAERPHTVAIADRVASLFSFVTLLLAVGVAVFWAVVAPSNIMTATLAVLVVTCPCALSLATPAAFAAATSRLAQLGLLVVKPEALERLAKVDTIVFDKTGTLTSGATVAHVVRINTDSKVESILAIAAALERGSDHPLAQAFAAFADPMVIAREIQEFAGRGVQGVIGGQVWRLGQVDFVEELGRHAGDAKGDAQPGLALGTTPDGITAILAIEDEFTDGAREAIASFRAQGLRVAIASGDSTEAVQAAADALGISEFHARMDFGQKLARVKQLQSSGSHVLMVGDGINDGPVLAGAYVSCALTNGSAIAQSASDLLLLNRSLRVLADAVTIARRARQVVRQNLTWAFIYNVTTVPLAAAGYVPPWVAALGMSISSLAVVLNAARLAARRTSGPRSATLGSAASGSAVPESTARPAVTT